MAKLERAPTAEQFAKTWTAQFAGVIRDAAQGTEIDREGVKKIAARSDDGRLLADNVLNYLDAKGIDSANVEQLIASGYRYALSNGQRAANPKSGTISLVSARANMQADLIPDFFALRGKPIAGTLGHALYTELEKVAGDIRLGMFGEDSGTYAEAVFAKGPVTTLDAETALKIFGYKASTQIGSDTFDFQKLDPKDQDFWSGFSEFQDDAAKGDAVKKLLGGVNVVELASMVIEDHRPFGAPVYLLARLDDGSLIGLRGEIGGMSL